MSTSLLLCIALTTIIPAWTQVALDEAGKHGQVKIVAIDSFGRPLQNPTISIDRLMAGKLVGTIPGSRHMELEYGSYGVRLEQSGYSPVSRVIEIARDSASIMLCATVAPIDGFGRGSPVHGRVESYKSDANCRLVRLIPVYCEHPPLIAEAGGDGRFSFPEVKPGKYLAAVLSTSTGKICSLSEEDVQMGAAKDVTLSALQKSPR